MKTCSNVCKFVYGIIHAPCKVRILSVDDALVSNINNKYLIKNSYY